MGKKENYDFFSSRIIKVIGKRGEEESVKRKGREETERDATFQLIPCVCVITYIYIWTTESLALATSHFPYRP